MAQMIKARGVVLIIGGMLNPALLGIYTVGAEVATLQETELVGPLCRVCFASFAAARRAGVGIAETYLRVASSSLIIALPASVGISSVATPLVSVAFGAQWLQAAPVIKIIALAGACAVMGRISWTLFSAFAYLRSLFWFGVIITVIQFVLLVLFLRLWGIAGAALATAAVLLLEQAIYALLAIRRFAIPLAEMMKQIWRCLLATAVMAGFLLQSGLGWTIGGSTPGSDAVHLLATAGSGALVYGIALGSLWLVCGRPRGPERDVGQLIRQSGVGLMSATSRRFAIK